MTNTNAINNYESMVAMLSLLDSKDNYIINTPIKYNGKILGYHISWWNIPSNNTIHFYYDENGLQDKQSKGFLHEVEPLS